jgi:hypothetical protein
MCVPAVFGGTCCLLLGRRAIALENEILIEAMKGEPGWELRSNIPEYEGSRFLRNFGTIMAECA